MLAFNTPTHHPPTTAALSSFSSYSTTTMDPFDAAEPLPSDSVPPPYEFSQEEYETKISDTLQQSLRISQSRPSSSASRTPSTWESWEQESAQGAGRQSRGAGSETGGLDMQRRRMVSNTAISMGAGQKERPSWLGDDGQMNGGRRSAPGGPIGRSADAGYRPSRASAQTTSPIEEVSRNRLARRYDEEAGIDNPPPPFGAVRNDGFGSSGPSSYNAPASQRPRHQSSQSAGEFPSSSSSPSRHGYFGADAPLSAPSYQTRHSLPPPRSQRHEPYGMADQASTTTTPRLAFDPAVAYQSNYAYSGPPAAVNASAFYSSAVSSILNPVAAVPPQAQAQAPRSYTTTAPPPPNGSAYSTPQRQALPQPPTQSLNGSYSTTSTVYLQSPTQPQERRPTVDTSAVPQSQPSSRARRPSVSASVSPAQQSSRNPLSPTQQPQSNPPPRQSMEYYKPSYSRPQSQTTYSQSALPLSSTPLRGPPSTSSAGASSRPPSRQSVTATSPTVSFVTPPKPQPPTIVYKPGGGGNVPWMPPGAQRPQNVYERRF